MPHLSEIDDFSEWAAACLLGYYAEIFLNQVNFQLIKINPLRK